MSLDKPLNRMIANILSKLFPVMTSKFYIADSMEEALSYAEKALAEAEKVT